ncbi:hypothetical protein [Microbacterium sp. KHB019]|uniref:hypothetical protein n=1 Tax=Microbacterium sp. KHB019 TaxID=3129770 RepID=UPI0030796093
MRVIQLSLKSWLVLNDNARPQFLIVRAPMVHKPTGETHVVHRVERWNHIPESRHLLVVCDGEMDARKWCAAELEISARAAANRRPGVDPATGLRGEQLARFHALNANQRPSVQPWPR